MAQLTIEEFLGDFVPAVVDDEAAVFVGAGLSRSAGFVDWKQLLKDFADELGLDLDIETDLPAVAQYHLNQQGRIRSRLNQKLIDEFAVKGLPSDAHESLAMIPIRTFWTSNYDSLIEDALTNAERDPLVRKPGRSLTTTRRGADSEVLKLHGDADDPEAIVITKEDYERYESRNPELLLRLRNDLVTKSFLFVGFSFTDPNLELIFSQLRLVLGDSPRPHYTIFKKPQRSEFAKPARFKYELNRWQLRVQDLERFGIHAVVVDDYDDIPEILRQVRLRSLRKRVFVSGSSVASSPWPEQRLADFCEALGRRLVSEGLDLVSGFGLGIGSSVLTGALEELYRGQPTSLERRLLLRPFPQTKPKAMSRQELTDHYRRDLIAPAGYAIFIAGNKIDGETGSATAASGVRDEFSIARDLRKHLLPVGATGWVAHELWTEMVTDLDAFMPRKMPRQPFRKLGSPSASNDDILDALFSLIQWLATK